MKVEIAGNKKLLENGTELHYPGWYGPHLISIRTNDWVTHYEVKLKGRKPFLKLSYREKCWR